MLLGAGLLACSRDAEVVRERLLVWGTEASLDIAGAPPGRAREAIAAASAAMLRLTGEWHAWQPSDLVRINEALARGERVEAPPSVIELVERSRPLVRKTGRLFDPGIGGLIQLWGFHTDEYPIRSPAPDAALLDAWLAMRPSLLDLRVEEGHLRPTGGTAVQLDFGAVGEGAAMEIAAGILREHGIENALLTLGGDMLAMGQRGHRAWRVGIEDPIAGGQAVFAELELRDGEGLFTSGNYARFRVAPDGARWPHIIDPRTARPATGTALAVVLARDPVAADALSTVLMIAGPARFAELLQDLGIGCALLLTDQNELLITRGMQARIRLQREVVPLGQPLDAGAGCR
nr:FAD:protein FMN transferase [Lysobacter sp. CAU 1642]